MSVLLGWEAGFNHSGWHKLGLDKLQALNMVSCNGLFQYGVSILPKRHINKSQLYFTYTLLGSIVQLYSHIVNQSVYTCILSLLVHTLCLAPLQRCKDEEYTCTVLPFCYNCTLHGILARPVYCQPITEELQFTCFALIGPLVTTWTLIAAC